MTHLHVTDLPCFTSFKHKTRSPAFLIFKWNYSGSRYWFNLFAEPLDNTSPNFKSAHLWTWGFDFQESVLQKSLHKYRKTYLFVKVRVLQHCRVKLRQKWEQHDCQLTGDRMQRVRWIETSVVPETFKTAVRCTGQSPDHQMAQWHVYLKTQPLYLCIPTGMSMSLSKPVSTDICMYLCP